MLRVPGKRPASCRVGLCRDQRVSAPPRADPGPVARPGGGWSGFQCCLPCLLQRAGGSGQAVAGDCFLFLWGVWSAARMDPGLCLVLVLGAGPSLPPSLLPPSLRVLVLCLAWCQVDSCSLLTECLSSLCRARSRRRRRLASPRDPKRPRRLRNPSPLKRPRSRRNRSARRR